jgi:hypothetical protein
LQASIGNYLPAAAVNPTEIRQRRKSVSDLSDTL